MAGPKIFEVRFLSRINCCISFPYQFMVYIKIKKNFTFVCVSVCGCGSVFSMRLSEVDPYAVRSYSFAVRKTNSFFSATTLLLSAAVLIAAGLLCASTIAHLWLPRSALPLLASQSLALPPPLTSSLLCFASNIAGAALPTARILDINLTQLAFPSITSSQLRTQRPKLAAQITTDFACFDLQGYTFQQNIPLYIQIPSQNSSIYIQATSTQRIQQNLQSTFYRLTTTNTSSAVRQLKFINAVVFDSLYISSQPMVINAFSSNEDRTFGGTNGKPYASNNSIFVLRMYKPVTLTGSTKYDINMTKITITRYDIGYIVGAFLSWVSVLGLVVGLVVGPMMERALTLLQAEAVFLLPEAMQSPSLPRFVLGSLRRGLFRKEDCFHRLTARLEQLKDVALSLKLVRTLRRVSPKGRGESEVVASEQGFDRPPSDGAACFSEPSHKQGRFEGSEDTQKEAMPRSLLRWLDGGSDAVSVRYAGNGHGSGSSVCATLLFLAAFLAFLALFGVFGSQSLLASFDQRRTDAFSYAFAPGELHFASDENSTLQLALLDGNNKTLSTPTLSRANDPSCLTSLSAEQAAQVTVYAFYYCIPNTLTLTQATSNPSNAVSLYVNNVKFSIKPLFLFHFPSYPTQAYNYYNPPNRFVSVPASSSNTFFYYEQSLQLLKIASPSVSMDVVQLIPMIKKVNFFNAFTGINIRLASTTTTINESQTTIFDTLQSVWGFATICFAVLLVKLTKYMNLQAKARAVSPERAEFRDSICVLLSKVNALLHGRHQQQLAKQKHYLKERLNNSQ